MMEVKRLVGLDISETLHGDEVAFHLVYPVTNGIKILVRHRDKEEEIHLRVDDFNHFVSWLQEAESLLEEEKEERMKYLSRVGGEDENG